MQIILLSSIVYICKTSILLFERSRSLIILLLRNLKDRYVRVMFAWSCIPYTFLVIIMFRNCCNITWKNKLLVGNVARGCKVIQLSRVAMYWKSFDSFRKCRGELRNTYSTLQACCISKSATDYPHNLYRVMYYLQLPLSREKSTTM